MNSIRENPINRTGSEGDRDPIQTTAQGFGTDKDGVDVNGDGFVNILDLALVANAF
ncbi:MAG: dockerin type I domain-containing protein [Candidatus Poribacteria bacterium]|nr:dockerin type I domain-containing protein [Candidatus Poribacteria bacterium]